MDRSGQGPRVERPRERIRTRVVKEHERSVHGAKRRPRLTIAAALVAFGALSLAGRSLVRVVRGRREPSPTRPVERAPDAHGTARSRQ